MTPNEIDVLLHYHSMVDPHPRIHSDVVQKAVETLQLDGILSAGGMAKFQTTERGKAFVKMLCLTPYPKDEVKWTDPRTGEELPE